ncbi:helix-turn-helix domain-containing protein [Mycobacterium shigaense]|uniref:helix-turn-helix domain-containing protein n=1 Tax=Mycobacterium shigaense TaxID=722731 RepID=UPI002ADF7F3C|nr:helix-turn-helix domain-containing protein [Mycobacterium shigaense]MEA1123889.1 helix-turn-helix domain-containing protein [Mycobacterium shigaense]
MKLSEDDTEKALFCVNEVISHRRRDGTPVPLWMIQLGKRFDLASLTSEMSADGHRSGSGSAALDPDRLISTREAADLLGMSTRQVRRIANDLEAQRPGSGMVFRHSVVTEYARERRNGRHR